MILFTGGGAGIPACLAGLHGGVYPSMPCRFPGPHPGGSLGVWHGGAGSPGPHPEGKLRGLDWGVSRPTPRGRLRGLAGGVFRPTAGGCPGPQPGEGVSQHALRGTHTQTHTHTADSYCCEQYASNWNAFLFKIIFDEM